MEGLTCYLKEVAFDPMRARAIQNSPGLLKNDPRLDVHQAGALMAGDIKEVRSIIARESGGVDGNLAISGTTVVVVVLATDGIEPLH